MSEDTHSSSSRSLAASSKGIQNLEALKDILELIELYFES